MYQGIKMVIILFLALVAMSFTDTSKDGWYMVTGNNPMTLAAEPIVTVADFASVRLDSGYNYNSDMVYIIYGYVAESKRAVWAGATEKAVGKQIAFVWNGEIITSPTVNMPLESGNFAISGTDSVIKDIYFDIVSKRKTDVQL